MKRKNKFLLLLSALTCSCCIVGTGLLSNGEKSFAADAAFQGFEIDFTDDTITGLITKTNSGANWSITNGQYQSNGSWAELYLTGKPIPMSTGDKMTVVEIDFTYETVGAYFNIGIIPETSFETSSDGAKNTDSLNFGMSATTTFLRKGRIGNFDATWLARNVTTFAGAHTLTITLNDGNAAFMVDGEVLSSTVSNKFDVNEVTGDSFYLDFCVPSKTFALDNIKVYQDIKDPDVEELRASTKSFEGLDEKTLTNVNTDMLTVTYKRLLESNVPNLTGAKYLAMEVVNTAGAETGLAVDLTQGVNTGNYGNWWTAAEYLPYYLLAADGVQEGYLIPYETSLSNRAYARVPADFEGKVILPFNSFEVMCWSANSASVANHTQDSNALDLSHIGWIDVYGKKLSATGSGLTVNGLSVLGDNFADVEATVENTQRAIADVGTVTLGSESKIAFARARYNALSAEDQQRVNNADVLTAAENAFSELKNSSALYVATNGKDFTGTEGVAFNAPFESSPVTVSAWIKVDRKTADNTHVGTIVGNMERSLLSSHLFDANNTFSMEITTNGNPRFEWRVSRTKKANFVVENVDVRTGSWLHLAFVRNVASRQIECYVNGTLVATQGGLHKDFLGDITMVKPAIIGSDYTNDDVLACGYTPDFNGCIANVRVYDTVLTKTDIAQDLQGEYAKTHLLGGVDFMSGETDFYYDRASDDASDYFGWKAIDEKDLWVEEGEYTIAIQGDTQMYLSMAKDANGNKIYTAGSSEINPDYDRTSNMMYKNNTWLVANQSNLNLQFLTHMGDMTDYLNYSEWATKGVAELNLGLSYMDILTDGGVKWSMNRGNHDGGNTAERLAAWDNGYNYAKYGTNVAGYYGDEANMRNVYYTFEVNTTKYMVVALDLEPSDAALAWAKEVIDANQDRRVIITTHVFMDGQGNLITSKMCGENAGQGVWDKLASKCPNVIMVLCGHSSPIDITRRAFVGDNGNTVWGIVVDDSILNYDVSRQVGLLALMKFSADGKKVAFRYYSPSEGKLYRSVDQFEIDLDLSYFEDKSLEFDFSTEDQGAYFTRAGESTNGNFTVKDGKLCPAANWVTSVYNQPISATGTYKITLDFYIANNVNFFIGLIDGINDQETTHNVCFAYLGSNKNSYLYNYRFGANNWLKTIGTDYVDGKIHKMGLEIVDGMVTIMIDDKEMGVYDKMIGLDEMYLAFKSADTGAYVDNLKIEYLPPTVEVQVVYDNYGDVALKTDGYLSGALPALSKSGHVFVGYSIDGSLYPAGYVLDTAEGKEIVAVFSKFTMLNGGSIKAVSGEYGIRFAAYIDKDSKSYLTNAEFGAIMAHTDEFGGAFSYSKMTFENLELYNMRSMITEKYYEVGGYTCFNTVIDKLKDISREFACVAYVTVTYADDSTTTLYATVTDNRRTIQEIAQKAYDDVSETQSGDYIYAVTGGYSSLTVAQRNTLLNIIGE